MTIRYFLTCIFLYATFLTNAQRTSTSEADSLYNACNYFEASVAYERVLFLSNANEPAVNAAIIRNIDCLKKQGKFKEAITFCGDHINSALPDSFIARLLYEQALCSYLLKKFENTVSLVEQANNSYPQYEGTPLLRMLKILSLCELQKWSDAKLNYNQFMRDYSSPQDSLTNLFNKLPKLKSADKAQWLATVIPGAGQIYAGKPWEGLVSIAIQGVALYYAYISLEEKYYISAWLGGVGIFASFHNGGVRRSEALVQEYNAKKIQDFNYLVKKQLVAVLNR